MPCRDGALEATGLKLFFVLVRTKSKKIEAAAEAGLV
jgi:hypothetical protein